MSGEGAAPHFNQDSIDHCRAASDGSSAVPCALAGLADERHLAKILIPKIVNRQSDWIHEVYLQGLPKQLGRFNRISDFLAGVAILGGLHQNLGHTGRWKALADARGFG